MVNALSVPIGILPGEWTCHLHSLRQRQDPWRIPRTGWCDLQRRKRVHLVQGGRHHAGHVYKREVRGALIFPIITKATPWHQHVSCHRMDSLNLRRVLLTIWLYRFVVCLWFARLALDYAAASRLQHRASFDIPLLNMHNYRTYKVYDTLIAFSNNGQGLLCGHAFE